MVVIARRYEIVNWVPTKQDVPVIVEDETISLDKYVSRGLQEGEELITEDEENGKSSKFVPNETVLSFLEAMGFPRIRSEKALHATGNSDADAASNWLFAHMDDSDIDTPVELPGHNNAATSGSAPDLEKITSLESMGFSVPQARQALRETDGDVERAVDWLFSHPDATGDSTDELV